MTPIGYGADTRLLVAEMRKILRKAQEHWTPAQRQAYRALKKSFRVKYGPKGKE